MSLSLQIGGMSHVIVFDTSYEHMTSQGADSDVIEDYRTNALPVLAHYDDAQKLTVVNRKPTLIS